MKKIYVFSFLLGVAVSVVNASASEGVSTTEFSNRMSNKLGFGLSVGEPAPAILAVNLNYNVLDYLKVQAGYGHMTVTTGLGFSDSGMTLQESSVTTVGGGIKAMVPGWNLTPSAGLHFANVSYTGDGLSVGGFSKSGSHVYASLGVDYQSKGGFNAAAGITQSFRSGVGTGMFLSLGWYFDWLNRS